MRGITRPRGLKMNDHLTRYRLPDEWFIDREDLSMLRYMMHKYTLWEPGAGSEVQCLDGGTYRIAAYRGGAETLRATLEIHRQFVARQETERTIK